MASYEFLDHTGELAIKVKGQDLLSLFVNAAGAMTDYLNEGYLEKQKGGIEEVEVSAPDEAGLLVAWLSEILYRTEVNKKIYNDFLIKEFTKNSLRAKIRGSPIKKLRKDIKAVTHHDLEIKQVRGGYETIITFDI